MTGIYSLCDYSTECPVSIPNQIHTLTSWECSISKKPCGAGATYYQRKGYQLVINTSNMDRLLRGSSLSAIILAAASSGTLVAHAQEEDAVQRLGAVTITARRAEENLQDVPIAITAIGSDAILDQGIANFHDIAAYTPGLTFKDFVTGFNGVATMRGLTQANVQDTTGNVGTFVDGIYLQRGYMVNFALADMERIEVVKGPQSALYGQNTFSGAINIVTKRPGNELQVDTSATIGDYDRREFKLGVGGPIIRDILGARVFYGNSQYGGTIENNYPSIQGDFSRFGGYEREAYSGTVVFTPTSNLTFEGFYQHYNRDEEQRAYYTMEGNNAEWSLNADGGSWFAGTIPTDPASLLSGANPDRPTGLFSVQQPTMITETDLYRLSGEWLINEAFSLNYLYGKAEGSALENFWFPQNSFNPIGGLFVYQNQHEGGTIDFESQELRLNYDNGGRFTGEAGVYKSKAHDMFTFGLNVLPATGEIPRLTRDPVDISAMTVPFQFKDSNFETEAVFARGDLSFLDGQLIASLEGRYTVTDVKVRDVLARRTATNNGQDPDVVAPDLTDQWKEFTPRATLSYFATPDNMLYASAGRGVKAGGFNGYVTGPVPLDEDERSYGPESNWTYEVGAKNQFLNGRLQANVAVFFTDWKNQQISVVPRNYDDVIGDTGTQVPGIWGAVGDSTAMGIELEANWVPNENWKFFGNLAYTKTEYGEGANNPAYGNVAGNTIPGASPLSISTGLQYDRPLTGSLDGFFAVDVNYDSDQYVTPDNRVKIDGRALVNARIGVTHGSVKAFAYVKNLTDEMYVDGVFTIRSLNRLTPSFGERRTVGLTVSYSY